jgi:hypothetical protein
MGRVLFPSYGTKYKNLLDVDVRDLRDFPDQNSVVPAHFDESVR